VLRRWIGAQPARHERRTSRLRPPGVTRLVSATMTCSGVSERDSAPFPPFAGEGGVAAASRGMDGAHAIQRLLRFDGGWGSAVGAGGEATGMSCGGDLPDPHVLAAMVDVLLREADFVTVAVSLTGDEPVLLLPAECEDCVVEEVIKGVRGASMDGEDLEVFT
jgi:hypothetical protein